MAKRKTTVITCEKCEHTFEVYNSVTVEDPDRADPDCPNCGHSTWVWG